MKISRNTWHYKAFNFWFKQKWGRSTEEYEELYDHPPQLNLCSYVRIVLFWSPLRFVFSRPRIWFLLSGVGLAILCDVYKHKGLHGLFVIWVLAIYFCVAMAAFLGIVFGIAEIHERLRKHPIATITSFTEVLSERVKAAHEGICPLITLVDDPKPTQTPTETQG